jgi:hypothetical protein
LYQTRAILQRPTITPPNDQAIRGLQSVTRAEVSSQSSDERRIQSVGDSIVLRCLLEYDESSRRPLHKPGEPKSFRARSFSRLNNARNSICRRKDCVAKERRRRNRDSVSKEKASDDSWKNLHCGQSKKSYESRFEVRCRCWMQQALVDTFQP